MNWLRKKKSKPDKKKSHEIDKYLSAKKTEKTKTITLLLLGPGGSGKSTILKQMEKIYRGNVHPKILKEAAHYIRQNVLEDIYDLANQNSMLNAINNDCKLSNPQSYQICHQIANMKGSYLEDLELTSALAEQISILWNDPGMQATFNIRRRSHIMDNAPYFFNSIQRIASKDYYATFEDYIRVRHRTTGIIESEFDFPNDNKNDHEWKFKVIDVGGQRTERKKWMRCFEDINAVVYVMSLAAYDQNLFEDHTQNCYAEAFKVFSNTMDHPALKKVDCIVFLNKNDLFEPKIKEVAFTVFEKSFDPTLEHNANAVKNYVKDRLKKAFEKDDKSQTLRRLHFHITSATDTNQIQTVMHLIQFETVRKMMKIGMLL